MKFSRRPRAGSEAGAAARIHYIHRAILANRKWLLGYLKGENRAHSSP